MFAGEGSRGRGELQITKSTKLPRNQTLAAAAKLSREKPWVPELRPEWYGLGLINTVTNPDPVTVRYYRRRLYGIRRVMLHRSPEPGTMR